MRRKFTKKDFKPLFLTLLPSIVWAFEPLVNNFNDTLIKSIFIITCVFLYLLAVFQSFTEDTFLQIAIFVLLLSNTLVAFCLCYMTDSSLLIHEMFFLYFSGNGCLLLFITLAHSGGYTHGF